MKILKIRWKVLQEITVVRAMTICKTACVEPFLHHYFQSWKPVVNLLKIKVLKQKSKAFICTEKIFSFTVCGPVLNINILVKSH